MVETKTMSPEEINSEKARRFVVIQHLVDAVELIEETLDLPSTVVAGLYKQIVHASLYMTEGEVNRAHRKVLGWRKDVLHGSPAAREPGT